MFVENLVGSEKSAFLGLARKVGQADGVLSPREAQLLSSFAAATEAEFADGTVQELASAPQTPQSKVSVAPELIELGYADGEYRPIESALIGEISRALELYRRRGRGHGELGCPPDRASLGYRRLLD